MKAKASSFTLSKVIWLNRCLGIKSGLEGFNWKIFWDLPQTVVLDWNLLKVTFII